MDAGKPAYEDFYVENYMKVYLYLCKRMENRSDAEDLTQEIFMYCYKSYENFHPEKSSITTWLYVVTNSRLKNYYRDKKEYTDLESLENYFQPDCNDLENSVYIQQIRDSLADAIGKLPERQQQVVIYKFFYGKNHGEIARLLGISESNSKAILARAIKTLEKYMNNFKN